TSKTSRICITVLTRFGSVAGSRLLARFVPRYCSTVSRTVSSDVSAGSHANLLCTNQRAATRRPYACQPTSSGNSTRVGLLSLGEQTQGEVMNPNEQKPGQQGGQGGQQGGGGQPKPGQQGQQPGQGGQHGGQQKPGQGGQGEQR